MANEQSMEARLKALEEKNAKLMAALEAQMSAAPGGGIGADQLETILTKVTAAASKTSELIASKHKPENVDHLHRGPFEHPDGGLDRPKPELRRTTYAFGARLRVDELTYAEVEAVNTLNASLRRSERRVCHDGKWIAKVNDDDQTLIISVPCKTLDDKADLPPFIQIMQELTSGERAQDVGELAQELALLKSQMAQLQAAAH
jgi:hypothetical protein